MQTNDGNKSNPSSLKKPWYTKTAGSNMMNKQGFLAGLSGTTEAGPTAAAIMQSDSAVTFWKNIQHNYTKFDKLVNTDNYYQ